MTQQTYTIKEGFSILPIHITPATLASLEKMVIQFELRATAPLALNSQTLGIHPIVFTAADRASFFHLFHLEESEVARIVRKIPSIDPKFKVISDPFNLLCIWVIHLAFTQLSNYHDRHKFQWLVAKYLHYRFFTSLVNYYFMHGANEAVMLATINSLSKKFDIITQGSWRLAIEARCTDLIDGGEDGHKSIHYDTLVTMDDDIKIIYVISDVQSRIRDKVKIVNEVYYRFHKEGIKISSSSATYTDSEGEKILVQRASTLDIMTSTMITDVVNVNAFVDSQAVTKVASQFPAITPTLLRESLEYFSMVASRQAASGEFDAIQKNHDGELYIGIRTLVEKIIQISFRYCVNNRISLKDKASIWNALRNMYTSSRVNDVQVIAVKNSIRVFVDNSNKTQREATKSSLRIALIMYVIYRCLRFL
jgi:hypothetical protein